MSFNTVVLDPPLYRWINRREPEPPMTTTAQVRVAQFCYGMYGRVPVQPVHALQEELAHER